MKKIVIASVAFLTVVVMGATKSSAQVAAWDVAGQGSPFSVTLNANTPAGNLTGVPVLSRGGGLLGNSAANSFGGTNWNNTATFDQTKSYYTFTVTPAGGFQLNLTTLQYTVNGSGTLPNTGQWGYSTDGGTTFTLQTAFTIPQAGGALSTWDFADFGSSSAVEFRFWAWGTTAINSVNGAAVGGSGRIFNTSGNDLVLNGSVDVIPEPSTLSLIGFGILGMVAFARRRFNRG
jgi:hypothetical protein